MKAMDMSDSRPAASAAGPVAVGEAPAIELEAICKRFGRVCAVEECTLTVPRGAFVSLLGPSGCGKTTLLRLIGGFERQDGGTIRVHGDVVDGLPPNKRNVNTVFQGYALFPHKTVFDNVAFPLEIKRVPKAERRERVREMLALVRLEGMEQRRAAQLSGGQKQRVALARALVGRPEVLLFDEPLAALDLKLRKTMQFELRRIQRELRTTFLYVTHDQSEALTMSDQIVLMDGGQVVQEGGPVDLYERPSSVFASSFIGETNLLAGEVAAKWRRRPGAGGRRPDRPRSGCSRLRGRRQGRRLDSARAADHDQQRLGLQDGQPHFGRDQASRVSRASGPVRRRSHAGCRPHGRAERGARRNLAGGGESRAWLGAGRRQRASGGLDVGDRDRRATHSGPHGSGAGGRKTQAGRG